MFARLKDLRVFLANLSYTNYGGCAIAAKVMYTWIKEHYPNADIQLVYLYSCSSWNYDTNQSYLEGTQKDEASGCSHAAIRYKGITFDCEKVVDVSEYLFEHNITDMDFMQKSLNSSCWNSAFDRRQIPLIEKRTGYKLNLEIW